jgi:hypothetical protein
MTHSREELQADRPASPAEDRLGQRERLLVAFCCLLAVLRVSLFTLAYPFFDNVDEQEHFDLVCKYSHGELPRGLEPFSAEAAGFMALYHSPEYCWRLEDYPGGKTPPPVWSLPAAERAKMVPELTEGFQRKVNFESAQMPLYYVAVGAWYNLGKLLGLEGGNLLYWTRFLNLPAYFAVVWLAYLFAKELLPGSPFVYLGAAAILAVFPQDIFYCLSNDVFSAPFATLSLYLLLRLYRSEAPRPGLALCAGLSAAAAVLSKFINPPLLLVVGIVAVLKVVPAWWKKQPLVHLLPALLLVAAAGVPVACWLARNYVVFGDLTGYVLNNRFKTWTPKPVSEYWHHPIFTPSGCWVFWSEFLRTFWRGQMRWHYVSLAASPIDSFYVVSSTLFLLAFAVAAVADRRGVPAETRLFFGLGGLLFAGCLAILVLISISFDFGHSNYPSRRFPYLPCGRYLMGAVVPFFVMYLGGLEAMLERLQWRRLRLPLLIGMAGFMAVSEISYSLQVFASRYNWYHLP